ncbi:amino acid adenylation domain-containing protein [Streptomyces sp. NPDC002446]
MSHKRTSRRSARPLDPQELAGSLDALRAQVSAVLGAELGPADDEADLFALGLQSLQLMQLTNRLNRAGLRADFTEMARDARLTTWYAQLSGAGREAPAPSAAGTGPAEPSAPADGRAPFPLTPVQQAYWIGRADGRTLGGVGCHAYLEFDAPHVDADRLEGAVRALMRRHPMLRARFDEDGTQRVLDTAPWPGLTVHDHSGQPPAAAERELLRRRETLSHRRLDVARGEVLDVQLSRLPGGGHRIHVGIDLLVADVHSFRLILGDLAALYEDPSALPELGYGFAQYLADRDTSRAADRARAEEYWTTRLPELPGGPRLPLKTEPEDLAVTRFVRRTHELPPHEWAVLQRRATEHGITPSVLLATAFAEILARWSGEQHFLLNLPLFDRDQATHADIGGIVADFTSLVLLEIDLTRGTGFAERAKAVQQRLHDDVGHAAYTGVDVLRDFVRADGETPRTAPVVFACNVDAPLVPDAFAGLFGELSWMVSQTPQVWLDCQVYRTRDGGLQLAWDAVDELFPDGVLDTMLSACGALLRELMTADWGSTPDIPLPEAQRRRRDQVNSVARGHSGRLLHEEFFARAAERDAAPALLWGPADARPPGAVTHRELAERALRIAGALAGRGIGRGSPVVVTAPKGPDQIAAVLGVLAAGGTYIPLGTDQPAERRERILARSGARLVLAGGDTLPAAGPGTEVLPLERALAAEPLSAPVAADPDDTAYVIFTSGSTGTPKGVEVSHRAAVNTVEDINERFAITGRDRVLAVSALDFDLSVWDVFGLLSRGGALVLVAESDRRDAQQWLELCERHRVSVWNSVPALMDMLLTAADGAPLPTGLRLALLSGDWIGLDLPAALREASGGRCRLVGLGGATEAAIWSNFHEVDEVPAHWRSIPYGTPLSNQRFRVVDPRGRDCPDWVAGELWIGGDGVALGYRGDAELTAGRFVRHRGERWYRTGDLGRYWPDGTLEFLGRADHQVKINGFRVELGEIEAALQSHPGLAHAVTVAVGDRRKELVAAVVERRGTPPATDRDTSDRLPDGPAADQAPAAVQLEHALTEAFLATVLDRLGLGRAPGAAWSPPVPEDLRPMLTGWVDYLTGREVLTGPAHTPAPGPRWAEVRGTQHLVRIRERAHGTYLETVADAWERAVPLLTAVLKGEAPPTAPLDDPALAPDGLGDLLPGARASLAAVGDGLRRLAQDRPEPLAVVEWAGTGGRSAARLLEETGPTPVTYTLMAPSAAELAAAGTRLAGAAHTVRTVLRDGSAMPETSWHRFDAVVVNDALGRIADPDAAAAAAALLGRAGARLWLVARTAPSPLPLPGGAAPAAACDAGRWLRALRREGFTDVRPARTEPDGVVLITAQCPPRSPAVDADALRTWLAGRLPAHMIPGTVVALPALPLSGNGKVDRRRVRQLLDDCADRPQESAEPPRGETEQQVAQLWADVLGARSVAREASFFVLGGDSLRATRLVTAVRRRFGVELPMREVLRVPTVAGMGALITQLRGTPAAGGGSTAHEAGHAAYEVGVL